MRTTRRKSSEQSRNAGSTCQVRSYGRLDLVPRDQGALHVGFAESPHVRRSFTTAAGTSLRVSVDGNTVMVEDATVVRYDLQASNGVIHVIEGVLTPPEA